MLTPCRTCVRSRTWTARTPTCVLVDAQAILDAINARALAIINTEARDATSPWREWEQKLAAFKINYSAAIARSAANAGKMEQLRQIEAQLAVAPNAAEYRKEPPGYLTIDPSLKGDDHIKSVASGFNL